ncbi:ShlB/FhaC/HecB family hemolysin secretion/activation protein [Methylomonas sp. 2BW1-5-20]|uniref:ShlB/FhaC/HecB family hemolysin secretion/activation protein n=1 Tax=Methylomonas sp. 2BW1-5-20 TaxID=3376686 RepID=UPI00404E18E1
MDRPSARPLPFPEDKPDKADEVFSLPPITGLQPRTVDSRKVPIKRILLDGNTVFTEQELNVLIENYQNRLVSINDIEPLRQRLTQYYIDRGYINSGAVVAADALQDGELRIHLVEGKLSEVRVSGEERLRESYIVNRLQADDQAPLKLDELRDRFQTLLSDPLIERMNGRMLPGNSPGQAILDVEVTRARPYQLSLFGDNYRPPSIGAEAFGLNGWVRNLTGLGDVLDFNFIYSAGSSRYFGGFSAPVTDSGTQVFFHFDEGDSSVIEQPLKSLDIQSKVHNLEGGFSYPLISSFRKRLSVGLTLAVRENQTSLLGLPFSFTPGQAGGRNQATVWRIFQDGLWRGERQALAARSSFSVGMNALGATAKTSARYPSSEFFSWLGQAQYAYQVLDDGSRIVLRGNAQFSDAPLLPLEQIAVGGMNSVRGYRENHLVRDNGYSVSLEFHYPLFKENGTDTRHRLSLIPFFDYGAAWNNAKAVNNRRDALYSVGLGLSWQFSRLSADFFYGYALNRSDIGSRGDLQDDGIHFQARFDVF